MIVGQALRQFYSSDNTFSRVLNLYSNKIEAERIAPFKYRDIDPSKFRFLVIDGENVFYKSLFGFVYEVYIPKNIFILKLPRRFIFARVFEYKISSKYKNLEVVNNFLAQFILSDLKEIEINLEENYITYDVLREDLKKASGVINGIQYEEFVMIFTHELDKKWIIVEKTKEKIKVLNSGCKEKVLALEDLLIIEDNALFLNVIEKFLVKNGIEPSCISSFSDVCRTLELKTFKVIISDYKINEETACQYIQNIKRISPKVKLLILSSSSDRDIKLRCLKLGADLFIEKSEDPQVMLMYIKKALGLSCEL